MGSTKWNGKKGVQCNHCELWMDATNHKEVPSHKPKGDILSARDCPGTGNKPKRHKGFPQSGSSPYDSERRGR